MMLFEGQVWQAKGEANEQSHQETLILNTGQQEGGHQYLSGFKSELVIKMSPVQSFKAAGSMRLERKRCHIISENKAVRRRRVLNSGRLPVYNK